MRIAQARALKLSRGLFTVRRAGKGAILALVTLGIAGIIASQESIEEVETDELKKRLKTREASLQATLIKEQEALERRRRIGGSARGGKELGMIGRQKANLKKGIAEIRRELDIRAVEDELRREEALVKAGGPGGIGALGLGADLTKQIRAPISQRIVKIDTLNIPLNIPETVDRQMFLDILRDVFENEVLNAEGIEPAGN